VSEETRLEKTLLIEEFVNEGRSESCPIIDMHGHYGPFSWIYMPNTDAESMIITMDRAGVKTLVCSSHHGLLVDTEKGNNIIRDLVIKYPRRFFGYLVINPYRPDLIENDLENFHRETGFLGLKLWPDYHQYPLTGERYIPALEYANKNSLSVLIHTWGYSPFDGPELVEEIAGRYSEATLIMGHSGYGEWDRSIALAKNFKNVFLELTAVYATHEGIVLLWCPERDFGIGVNGIIEKMVNEAGSEKILFGTDLPWYSPHYAAGSVLFSNISADDVHNIFHKNAEKIFQKQGVELL
jgi:predicted TIM-barrel fold metal-dependent hydrolase